MALENLIYKKVTLSLRRGLIPVDTPMATSLSTTIGGRHNIGLEQIISNNLRILCFHLQKPFIRGGGYEERSFIAQLDFLLLTIGDMDVGEFIVPIPYVKQIKVKLHPAFDVNGLFPFVFSSPLDGGLISRAPKGDGGQSSLLTHSIYFFGGGADGRAPKGPLQFTYLPLK